MIVRLLGCEALMRLIMEDAMARRNLRYGLKNSNLAAVETGAQGSRQEGTLPDSDQDPAYV